VTIIIDLSNSTDLSRALEEAATVILTNYQKEREAK
jgi:hypothetical protein